MKEGCFERSGPLSDLLGEPGNGPSSELISFTFTQQMRARVHAFKTSTSITEDPTNNEAFGRNASGEL